MKARYLKKLLMDTRYMVADHGEYIAVGSPMCHDLISVDKKTLKMKYALAFREHDREALVHKNAKELLFIWDKLEELIKSGEIKAIIEENDELDKPLEIWMWHSREHKVVKKYTDAYGWPNVTHDGEQIYENYGWPTRKEALEHGLKSVNASIDCTSEGLAEITERVIWQRARLEELEKARAEIEAELKNESEA